MLSIQPMCPNPSLWQQLCWHLPPTKTPPIRIEASAKVEMAIVMTKGRKAKQKTTWHPIPEEILAQNTNFDSSLKSTKQAILKTHKRANLRQLLCANKTATIVDVLKSIGLVTTDCGCFHMWGGCYGKNCWIRTKHCLLCNRMRRQELLIESQQTLLMSQWNQ